MAPTNTDTTRILREPPSSQDAPARLIGADTVVPGVDGRPRPYANLDDAASTPGSSPLPQASATRPAITTDHDAGETATQTFNARDLDGPADVLADDVVCRVPGGGEERGKAACVEFHRRWLADFPDAHIEVRARHMIDDSVVEEGTFRGTHAGVARTGRSVCLDHVRVARIRRGKHVSLQMMFDRLLMLEQLGLA